MKKLSLLLPCFLAIIFGYQIHNIDDVDRILSLPSPKAGRNVPAFKEPFRDVLASTELDKAAVEVLESLSNSTLDHEHVGYLTENSKTGAIEVSEPQLVKTVSRRRTAYARITLPKDKAVLGVYHDHFRDTLPGPGTGDAAPLYHGIVSYIKDEKGNIFKIEFSERWKTPENEFNGWRLTTLKGRRLSGQSQWRPGIIFTRYVSRRASSYFR